ncbi:uncharacterized protein LOC131890097 [Tigriopus californicus]|uniref:uncharacterized protein LOC131890097 n=1 Tax=Tigriopus californicus TaxID=6832 RepID=UPI0027D9F7E4|nr:uncharacterized protein LOC131890097 [Tigriopus californicus]
MDDVYVVVGLLFFGSLLFCLCCYKVSNLLYMLYHIDDTHVDYDDDLAGLTEKDVLTYVNSFSNGPTGNNAGSGVGGGDSSAPTGVTSPSGVPPPLRDVTNTNERPPPNNTSVNLPLASIKSFNPSTNAQHSSSKCHGNYIIEGGTYRMKPAHSVTSLSIGVQCSPQDAELRSGSDTCLLPVHCHSSSNVPVYKGRKHERHPKAQRVHQSHPDFRHFDYMATTSMALDGDSQRDIVGSRNSDLDTNFPISLPDHVTEPDAYCQGERTPTNAMFTSGSLDRQWSYPQSGTWKQPKRSSQSSMMHHDPLQNLSRPKSSFHMPRGRAQRIGSIRVAECSFIEQHDNEDQGQHILMNSLGDDDEDEDDGPPTTNISVIGDNSHSSGGGHLCEKPSRHRHHHQQHPNHHQQQHPQHHLGSSRSGSHRQINYVPFHFEMSSSSSSGAYHDPVSKMNNSNICRSSGNNSGGTRWTEPGGLSSGRYPNHHLANATELRGGQSAQTRTNINCSNGMNPSDHILLPNARRGSARGSSNFLPCGHIIPPPQNFNDLQHQQQSLPTPVSTHHHSMQ